MRDLISVIIPVYNADQYLRRCLDSILSQSYTTLEVILIDDGSQDNSPALCDALAQHDARIRVIHQENQGVSAARNTGIAHATGEYIAFVDADDYVANDFFEHLLQAATQQQADIVCCNLTELLNGEVVQLLSLPLVRSSRLVTDLPSVYADITGNQEAYWSCATCKLIRATIAKKHQFPPLKYGEQCQRYDAAGQQQYRQVQRRACHAQVQTGTPAGMCSIAEGAISESLCHGHSRSGKIGCNFRRQAGAQSIPKTAM